MRITVGDSEIGSKHDLIVNDKKVFDKFLKENEYQTINIDDVNGLKGLITIKSECENNCKYSWSRLSMVSIEKIPE